MRSRAAAKGNRDPNHDDDDDHLKDGKDDNDDSEMDDHDHEEAEAEAEDVTAAAAIFHHAFFQPLSSSTSSHHHRSYNTMEERQRGGVTTSQTLHTLELLFEMVAIYGDSCRHEAWACIVEIILILNELDIAPSALVEMDDFVDARGTSRMQPLSLVNQVLI